MITLRRRSNGFRSHFLTLPTKQGQKITTRTTSFILRNIPLLFRNVPCENMTTTAPNSRPTISTTSIKSDGTANKDISAQENGVSSSEDNGKRLAAFVCVDKVVKNGNSIGTGTGSTAKYAVQRLGEKYRLGQLKDIVCVPSSFQARQLILDQGLPLGDLERYQELDLCIDGADEVDDELNCIKGGGGCLTQEKIIMSCSRYFYIIADSRKMSSRLGDKWFTIPLEVLSMAYAPIKRRIENTEGGEAKLRMGNRKAGPVVTDNGNFILDWTFPKLLSDSHPRGTKDWTELNVRLKMIPGVVETGLFLSCAQAAYFGLPDGSVTEKMVKEDRRISPVVKRVLSPTPTTKDILMNGK